MYISNSVLVDGLLFA